MSEAVDFTNALLEMQIRDIRAAQLTQSIQQPGRELDGLVITLSDVDALAIAVEHCTPDQVARWVALLINFDPELMDDELEDEGDEDAD